MKEISGLGWRGKSVNHVDGRTGVILKEFVGGWWCDLTLRVDGQDTTESVSLGCDGDSGATGWKWNTGQPGEPERWSFLGKHNTADALS